MKHSPVHVFWVGLVVAGVTLPAAHAQAQTTLRYKFKEADKLAYVMEQKMEMKMTVAGNDITTTMNQTMDMTWKVTAVDKDGTAKITQTIDRVRVTIDGPQGKTTFDSKEDKDPEDAVGKAIAPIFRAMAGSDFTLTMSSLGEPGDVVVPKKILDAIKNAGPAGGSMSGDTLKQIASQAGLVVSKDAVKKGDSWNRKIEVKMDPIGKTVADIKATDEGEVTRDAKKLEKIALKPTLTLEAAPNAAAKLTLKKQDAKGTALFDNDKGQLVETALDQSIEMEVSQGGQTLTMQMKQFVGMKLTPPK